jgi:hypothetical protein
MAHLGADQGDSGTVGEVEASGSVPPTDGPRRYAFGMGIKAGTRH